MAFRIRTGYEDDLRLFRTPQSIASYAILLLVLAAAPLLVGSYFLSQIVFVLIYTIVGIGLVLLSGYAGQTSIGHAAFLAIGAYTAANAAKFGVPLYIYLPAAGLLTGLVGWLVGLPALRLHGIYLAIATFAFAIIVEEILARWESVTHGNEGMMVKPAALFGKPLGEMGLYYLCIFVTVVVVLVAVNVIRSPTGRAFLALRDSETAAKSMGVDSARYKTFAFALSAGMTGLAGVLYAHKLSFISPEMFTLSLSIEFVMIIIIGGIASLRGAALGAVFMIMVDPVLVLVKDKLPGVIGAVTGSPLAQDKASVLLATPGVKSLIFGLIIIFFIIYEPMGLDGRWMKIKTWVTQFPFYRPATFRRQKMYLKSERGR
ncbi:MAG: branched-chain amino acid ABC transporter permease [Beijerinckiaceae bacterium]